MNTIFIPVYPKPSGANITELCVDFNAFDPHDGVQFSVVMKNPADLVIDRTFTNLAGNDWQNWPPEQTVGDDYKYVKNVVLNNLGYTEAISPFIITQPVSLKVLNGEAAEFSFVASGDSPLSYQWFKNGIGITGANSATYPIPSVGTGDLGSYYASINNPVGSTVTTSVSLSLFQAPVIVSQPQSLNLNVSGFGNLNVGVMGDAPLSYQWNKDGQIIQAATGEMYQITNAQISDSGNYFVTVNNVAGSIQSNIAVITVNVPTPPPSPTPPVITEQPTSQSIMVGDGAVFNVNATGQSPITYQWFKDSVEVMGAVGNTYIIQTSTLNDSGNYHATVTNIAGSTTSNTAILTVNETPPPIISGDNP